MTDAELRLWSVLRLKQINGLSFNRQKVIGNYIVDFFCSKEKLVIEIDGGQHLSDEIQKADMKRDSYLENLGLKVLRFTNVDVSENTEGVVQRILENTHVE